MYLIIELVDLKYNLCLNVSTFVYLIITHEALDLFDLNLIEEFCRIKGKILAWFKNSKLSRFSFNEEV